MNITAEVIRIHNSDVLCVQTRDMSGLAPCSHEEAGKRIILYAKDAVKQWYPKVSMRRVDTDVVVLVLKPAQ